LGIRDGFNNRNIDSGISFDMSEPEDEEIEYDVIGDMDDESEESEDETQRIELDRIKRQGW